MRILQSKARPGVVYTYSYPGMTDPNSVRVEITVDRPTLYNKGVLRAMRNRDGQLMHYILNDAGNRISHRQANGTRMLSIRAMPAGWVLDDGIVQIRKIGARPGPRPKKTGDRWWGWVDKNPGFCESLLEAVVENGGYVAPSAHYFSLGYRGRVFAALFRNGFLGFSDVPADLAAFPLEKGKGKGTAGRGIWRRELRIILEAVVILRWQREFLVGFTSAFKKFVAETQEAFK